MKSKNPTKPRTPKAIDLFRNVINRRALLKGTNKLTMPFERKAAWRFWMKAVTDCMEEGRYDIETLETYLKDFAFDDYLSNLQDIVNKRYDVNKIEVTPVKKAARK